MEIVISSSHTPLKHLAHLGSGHPLPLRPLTKSTHLEPSLALFTECLLYDRHLFITDRKQIQKRVR